MARNTQKPTLLEIYYQVAFELGSPATTTVQSQRLTASNFLLLMNSAKRFLSTASKGTSRLAILIPEKNWIRTVARPYDLEGGIIRIDLQGQTRDLIEAGDSRSFQYENVVTGVGTKPNYIGRGDIAPTVAPDSFPLVAFPSECDMSYTDFPPALYGDREIGEPLTGAIMDIRVTGYGGKDPTSTDFPSADNPNSYLRDIFLVYALRRITYTTGTNGAIPYSPDAYLNTPWKTILGLAAGAGVAGTGMLVTFAVDGVTYSVTVTAGAYNATTNIPFTFRIRTPVGVTNHDFIYQIFPDDTPWQTVADPTKCTRWGNLFNDEALHSARPRYIAFNQWFVPIPDDMEEIRFFWEIDMDVWRQRLDNTDPTAAATVEEIVTSVDYSLNQTSGARQLYPISESQFSWLKWLEARGWVYTDSRDTGYYMRVGDRFMIAPRSRDPRSSVYALLYIALDDKYDIAEPYTNFNSIYVDLHGAQQEFFVEFIIWRYMKATQGSDSQKAKDAYESFMFQWDQVQKKMGHRYNQNADGAILGRELPMGRLVNKPYFDPIGDPDDWTPGIIK